MRKYLVVIPARLKSKRLPNKALLEIKGIPLVVRTFRQCKKAIPEKNIVVAHAREVSFAQQVVDYIVLDTDKRI